MTITSNVASPLPCPAVDDVSMLRSSSQPLIKDCLTVNLDREQPRSRLGTYRVPSREQGVFLLGNKACSFSGTRRVPSREQGVFLLGNKACSFSGTRRVLSREQGVFLLGNKACSFSGTRRVPKNVVRIVNVMLTKQTLPDHSA
jgi:hypothetical protein